MSEVAGRMSIQAGAHCLEIAQGGRGMLLGGVPGVPAAKVVVLGGGVVGTNAARMAMGLEAHVTILDVSLHRLNELDLQFGAMLNTVFSTIDSIEENVVGADLVIGGVLIPFADGSTALIAASPISTILEVRIKSATLNWQFRNLLGTVYETVPGYPMPTRVNLYGIRWNFLN